MTGYRIDLTPDDNDTLLLTSPEFPGLVTFGESEPDALRRGRDALEEAIAAHISGGEHIPLGSDPNGLRPPLLTEMKVALYRALRAEGITRAELTRRLGWHREQVDRLFRLDHQSKVTQLEEAMAAVGAAYRVGAERIAA